jgi:hypothetical protein
MKVDQFGTKPTVVVDGVPVPVHADGSGAAFTVTLPDTALHQVRVTR